MADFPTSVPSITNPSANDTLAAVPHDEQHVHANDNLAAIGTKLGTGSSTPSAYKYLVSRSSGTSVWVERPQFDVRDFGATAYSSRAAALAGSSSTLAINAAIIACAAAGGGNVFIPPGFYKVSVGANAFNAVRFTSVSNVHLVGAGIGATYLVSGGEVHCVVFNGSTDCSVSHMTIDGDSDNQSIAGHGVEVSAGGTRIDIHDLRIIKCLGYGIGLQSGTLDRVMIRHCRIEDTGADGIDFKNSNSANTPCYIQNVDILRPIRSDASGQSGIGVRGLVHISNVSIRGLDDSAAGSPQGINFKETDEIGSNGIGGHGSTLTNFYIEATAGLSTTASGVYISARDVTVSNGQVKGARYGVLAQAAGERARVTNVTADACLDYGFYGQHEDASFVNCTAVNGTTSGGGVGGGFYASQRSNVLGCLIKDNAGAGLTFQAASSATDSKIVGNTFDGNGSTVVTNSIVALFRDNTGYATEAWGSAVISGGTVTVAHGLVSTPQHVAPERGSGADITYSATSTEITFTGGDGTIRWYARYQP